MQKRMLLSLGCSVNYFVVAPSRAKNFHKYIHMKRNTKQSTISYNYVMTVTFLLVFRLCAGVGVRARAQARALRAVAREPQERRALRAGRPILATARANPMYSARSSSYSRETCVEAILYTSPEMNRDSRLQLHQTRLHQQ